MAEGRIMASASYDGTLKLWDLASADRPSTGGETTAALEVESPANHRHGGSEGGGGANGGANGGGLGEGDDVCNLLFVCGNRGGGLR